MEASRLNIAREKSPSLILTNRGNQTASSIEVGSKGQLDVELEIIGQKLEPDENGNEIMKYTLRVISASLITDKQLRAL